MRGRRRLVRGVEWGGSVREAMVRGAPARSKSAAAEKSRSFRAIPAAEFDRFYPFWALIVIADNRRRFFGSAGRRQRRQRVQRLLKVLHRDDPEAVCVLARVDRVFH